LFLLLSAALLADDWKPDEADSQQVAVSQTIDAFVSAEPRFAEYLDQAAGYAVFPRVSRLGFIWGGAYGKGLVLEKGKLNGSCSQLLASVGAQLGLQSYQQVILFRTEESLENFQKGRLEFQGRASVAVATLGKSANPAHLPDVAIFSLTQAGLMIEASANVVKFGYQPIVASP
jgi:lipid-binding SYLF domain-containing protein